jgi:Ni/Co efflux regulator RcnB
MKMIFPVILLASIAAPIAAHPEHAEKSDQVGEASREAADASREARQERYRQRVYRGRGVRPERRCIEIRKFDYNEGIVISRYVCL